MRSSDRQIVSQRQPFPILLTSLKKKEGDLGGQELNQSSIKTGNLQRNGNDEKSLKKNEKEEFKTLGKRKTKNKKQNKTKLKLNKRIQIKGKESRYLYLLYWVIHI